MTFNDSRRRVLRQLNSRYIYGRYPLLHAIVALVELAMVSFIVRGFNASYARRPILTTMITNAVLGGIADTVAQTMTAITLRKRQKQLNPSATSDESFFAIEFQEMDGKVPWPAEDYLTPASKRGPPPFDFERLTRFMSYGFIMAPIQHHWFAFLGRTFPLTKGIETMNVLRMVAMDQLIFSPCSLAFFFTFMTVTEGGGRRAIRQKFEDVYLPALKANFLVWPAVQFLNFRIMPRPYQIPLVSTVGIFWTAYLSLTNSSDEPIVSPGSAA